MAVKLRLRRMGKKRQPIYKVVAADVRSPRDGKFIEAIGLYNPKTDPATINIDEERALYWLGVGAQPTTTVKNLLSKSGITLKQNLLKKGASEEEVNAALEAWQNKREAQIVAALEKKVQKAEPAVEEKVEEKAEVTPEETVEEVKTENTEADATGTDSEEEKSEEGKE